MHSCPFCGHSRWVHRRSTLLANLAQWLTGWSSYRCLSCGWRGWLRVKPHPDHTADPHTAEFAPRQSVSDRSGRRYRRQFAFGTGILSERVRLLRQRTRLSVTTWVILACACGLVLGGVVFRRGRPATPPQISRAPDTQSSTQPTAQVSGAGKTPLKPGSPFQSAAAVKAGKRAPVQAATVRAKVAAEPAARPAKGVPDPRAVKLPRFRGSLAVDSHPRGARVFVDGQMAGATPIVLKNVAAGSRVVRIESDGYEFWSGAARVVADQQTRVTATLQR